MESSRDREQSKGPASQSAHRELAVQHSLSANSTAALFLVLHVLKQLIPDKSQVPPNYQLSQKNIGVTSHGCLGVLDNHTDNECCRAIFSFFFSLKLA